MIDPAELWDRYCEEVPAKRRSPQGAMAFAVDALTSAQPQADAVLDPELARTLTDNAAYVQSIRAATIEECAKLIESGAGMADLIDQDDLDQQAKYIRALALEGKP